MPRRAVPCGSTRNSSASDCLSEWVSTSLRRIAAACQRDIKNRLTIESRGARVQKPAHRIRVAVQNSTQEGQGERFGTARRGTSDGARLRGSSARIFARAGRASNARRCVIRWPCRRPRPKRVLDTAAAIIFHKRACRARWLGNAVTMECRKGCASRARSWRHAGVGSARSLWQDSRRQPQRPAPRRG